mmetsp:Transcript_3386/g.5892  ORF Transcript_3386/g.5892 Transcript_3386/m.5892 type:complete len:493 (+) Transcript_3386:3-1481(+)
MSDIFRRSRIIMWTQTESAKNHTPRCLGKTILILLAAWVFFIICVLARSPLVSELTASTSNITKSPVHDIVGSDQSIGRVMPMSEIVAGVDALTMDDFNAAAGEVINDQDNALAAISNISKSPAHKIVGSDHSIGKIILDSFSHAIESDTLPDKGPINFPLILRNGTLLCRRAHLSTITMPHKMRMSAVAEMIHAGLELYKHNKTVHRLRSELPFILLTGDGNGCDIKKQRDILKYPRLTWSYHSSKYGNDWCKAIAIPTFKSWENSKSNFTSYSKQYPWPSKINKAVWRGSTTYDSYFAGAKLNDTPRGKLVQKSMGSPELIDAGFYRFTKQYESHEDELANHTILTNRIPFDDQMKYKAILDIDGNNWSSRFPRLLCTNSVVIKIDPDYIEYFYHELNPMVHYVPASLENVTQVAAYVLDKENEGEMQNIVKSANIWCQQKMTPVGVAKDMMSQLEKYELSYNNYMGKAMYNTSMPPLITDVAAKDLVKC